MRKILNSLLFLDQWCIGVVDLPISAFLEGRPSAPVTWLVPPSPRRYYADPFGIEQDGKSTLVFEEFDYGTSRGHISSAVYDGENFSKPAPVLRPPRHLSYPFLLSHEGEVYCLPEDQQSRRVTLYRAAKYPGSWHREATLIEDFAGVDFTIFRHGDRWWLAGVDRFDRPYENLRIWHADRPTGPWTAHALGVVKRDISNSRPGGTPFRHKGFFYRPAQDCSRTYGGRIVINRVERLTPEEFEEVPVAQVEPFPGPFRHGLHTLSALGDHRTLVDGKKRVFLGARPSLWSHKIRQALRRLSAARASG